MIRNILDKLINKTDLSIEEARQTMNEIMQGRVNPSLLSGILIALKAKGESPEEIAGFAQAMRRNSIKVNYENDDAIDVCGTGGDKSGTFNISTATAFVVAATGVKVAKHGNRSISSKSGSADVLSELGVNINLPSGVSAAALNEIGITFLFAPQYHPAMKHAAQVRKDLKMKTIFNLLGPLTNPANVKKQMIGTFSNDAVKLLARAAIHLDFESVSFICAGDKYDEIILDQKTKFYKIENATITEGEIKASDFDYPEIGIDKIQGGSATDNAKIILDVFRNAAQNGAFHTICANAAFALNSVGYSDDIVKCKMAAEESIQSGAAYEKLNQLIEFGRKYSQ